REAARPPEAGCIRASMTPRPEAPERVAARAGGGDHGPSAGRARKAPEYPKNGPISGSDAVTATQRRSGAVASSRAATCEELLAEDARQSGAVEHGCERRGAHESASSRAAPRS